MNTATMADTSKMASRSADAGQKRPFIQRLFTDIAPRYDWFNRLASCGMDSHWRSTALRRADLSPGMRVLDVCAGTGDLALLTARRANGSGFVVGLDMNPAMLAYADSKSQTQQLPVSWVLGDAQALPFPDGSFDRVVIGFSTRNLSDLTQGLKEMVRVLKPQGKLVILETGRPGNVLLRAGYWLFLFTVIPVIGLLLTGRLWPFRYLAQSTKQFITPRQFVERLQSLATEAAYVPLTGGLVSLYLATKTGRA